MASSLASQLVASASINSALLSRRKPAESYLFAGRDADQHDLEAIHALGLNAFLHLATVNPDFRKFEGPLFSFAAKFTDRTTLELDSIAELDKNLTSFLLLLGPYLLEAPTGKVLEWLVRRFRINEFNVDAVLRLFLPYHESPHFTKMISILHIKPNTTWSFLLPFKAAAQPVPRVTLVTEMLQNTDLARFVTALLPNAIKGSYSHRCLLVFNAATLHDFILRSKALNEGTLAFLLPALLEPLSNRTDSALKEAILGSYILLAALCHKSQLTQTVLQTVVISMVNCAKRVDTIQFLNAVVSVCEPQEELGDLPERVVKTALKLPNIVEELRQALKWSGSEKFVGPMLKMLVRGLAEDTASSLLNAIIASPHTPTSLLRRLATLCITEAVSPEEASPDFGSVRVLLSNMQQRHASLFHQTIEDVEASNEHVKGQVEQLVVSLAMTSLSPSGSGSKENIDMVAATTNADEKVRAIAVKDLVRILSQEDSIPPVDQESIHSSLISRIQDPEPQVLEALYSNPAVVAPIMAANAPLYIDALSSVFSGSSKLKKQVLKHHLTFLLKHVWTHFDPSTIHSVYQKVLFPVLLFSKPRQHTADLVWEAFDKYLPKTGSLTCSLLDGCVAVWKKYKDEGNEDTDATERMGKLNIEIASRIAENILVSTTFTTEFESLITGIEDSNPHVRLMTCLIVRSLLESLSGGQQIEAACTVLDRMNLDVLAVVDDAAVIKDNEIILDVVTLANAIVLKPSSKNTGNLLQISLISLISNISPPEAVTPNWVAIQSGSDPATRYVILMRRLYTFGNACSSSSNISFPLLHGLFSNLGEDSLVFLSSFWASATTDLALVALRHAAAFLEAQGSELAADGGAIDFQTILPSLLVGLQSSVLEVRKHSAECISILERQAKSRKFSMVYKFDAVYGPDGVDGLQYLSQDEFTQYLGDLCRDIEHLVYDPAYLETFHREHLGKNKSDKKKDTEYKSHVLCYLLSHVATHSSPAVQLALVRSLRPVRNVVKAQILLPRLRALVRDRTPIISQELETLLLAVLDATIVKDLDNDRSSPLWELYGLALKYVFQPGALPSAKSVFLKTLENEVFAILKLEHQVSICLMLLEIGSQNPDEHDCCKEVLSVLIAEPALIIQLLHHVQGDLNDDGTRASKRAKLADVGDNSVSSLSLLGEVLASRTLPGSLELLTRLLETLGKLVQSPDSMKGDVAYVEQLLMSAIEDVSGHITAVSNLAPNTIRLDLLVDLIRSTSNPQTFHQALILIASLARLAPESVLHNIMPIFTFMGSNVFHRDDAYSFTVVQKTIDSIVPVMVSSLRKEHTDRLELYLAARDFLRVFTDAANHVPRHRRTSFFLHLIDVLGPRDFLTPLCLLLVQKVSNRIVKQNIQDLQSLLSLPITLLHHYPAELQAFVLSEFLGECQRLITRVINPESTDPAYLDDNLHEEHSPSPSMLLKRRAQALILFVSAAITSAPSSSSSVMTTDVISPLILLTSAKDSVVEDVVQTARLSLNRILSVVPVVDFIQTALNMLRTGDIKVQTGALELLGQRLPKVVDKARQEITVVIQDMLETMRPLVESQIEESLVQAAFKALTSIGATLQSGEENSIMSFVPLILADMQNRKTSTFAITALVPLPSKLGPRILPYFREIVNQTVAILRDEVDAWITDASAILNELLSSIPTFWGTPELAQVLKLCFDDHLSKSFKTASPLSNLMKAIAKRVPPKAVLPTVTELWPSLEKTLQLERHVTYFSHLRRCLRLAPRTDVENNLRTLFQVFLSAFEVSSSRKGENSESESQAILAFVELVVKLNEISFRPLFRRLYDWAFVGDAASVERRIIFCDVYIGLMDYFKGLMTPYMSYLFQAFLDALKGYASSSLDDRIYWESIVKTLSKSFTYDDGGLWRHDKLASIVPSLTAQVPVSVRLRIPTNDPLLRDCLTALTSCVTDDDQLKAINLNLLMHTRSEDVKLRHLALSCSESLWKAEGGKFLGFAAETAPFVVECIEDDDEFVVKEAFKLKETVESVAGNIGT